MLDFPSISSLLILVSFLLPFHFSMTNVLTFQCGPSPV